MKVRLLDIAELELDDAWAWHEAQAPGLGERFLVEIRAGRDLIAAFPQSWHPLGDGVRRFRLKRFPYGMIYVADPAEIVVLAVAHHHRDPEYWRGRLARQTGAAL